MEIGPHSGTPDKLNGSPTILSSKFLRKASLRQITTPFNASGDLAGHLAVPLTSEDSRKRHLDSPATPPQANSSSDTTIIPTSVATERLMSSSPSNITVSGASVAQRSTAPTTLSLNCTSVADNTGALSPSAESDIASSSASSPKNLSPKVAFNVIPQTIEPLVATSVSPAPLSTAELDDAKNLVLDLLGWGVPPEFLLESGVSAHAVLRIFTDLNLRLPANLVVSDETRALARSWAPRPPEFAGVGVEQTVNGTA